MAQISFAVRDPTPGEIYRSRGACSKCGAPGPLRGTGTMVVIVSETHNGAWSNETQRFCSTCAPVMKDALMELGFTFGLEPR